MTTLRIRLTGQALHFIDLLRDVGHVNDIGIARIVALATERYGTPQESTVDLLGIRTAAACVLFDQAMPAALTSQTPLVEDWPYLFS